MLNYFRDALKLYFKVTVGRYTALFLFIVVLAVAYGLYRMWRETFGAESPGAGAGILRGHYAYFYKPTRTERSVVTAEDLGQ